MNQIAKIVIEIITTEWDVGEVFINEDDVLEALEALAAAADVHVDVDNNYEHAYGDYGPMLLESSSVEVEGDFDFAVEFKLDGENEVPAAVVAEVIKAFKWPDLTSTWGEYEISWESHEENGNVSYVATIGRGTL